MILENFLKQLNYKVEEKEAQLQVEDNGSKIANAQGYCAGAREYRDVLAYAGIINIVGEETETPYTDSELKYKDLSKLNEQISDFESTEIYNRIQENKTRKIENRKDVLYYQSEKERDLYWCKGWHEAITQIEKWAGEIKSRYDVETERRQKITTLFEDDDE